MTREEAKDYIREWCPYDRREEIIKALEQEPCEDCISRQIISDYVEIHIQEINTGYGDLNKHTNEILRMIVDYIGSMPPVTPQPKTGHWIVNKKVDTAYDISGYKSWAISYACEHCGFIHQAIENHGVYRYCPNCGARMVEPQESEGKE